MSKLVADVRRTSHCPEGCCNAVAVRLLGRFQFPAGAELRTRSRAEGEGPVTDAEFVLASGFLNHRRGFVSLEVVAVDSLHIWPLPELDVCWL